MIKLISVNPLENYTLELGFSNGERRLFDVKPYLGFGIFVELKDKAYFKNVTTKFDSIAWKNGQDFSPETLYLKSLPLSHPTHSTPTVH
jgi:Protein of unknown function (DUF2442)